MIMILYLFFKLLGYEDYEVVCGWRWRNNLMVYLTLFIISFNLIFKFNSFP